MVQDQVNQVNVPDYGVWVQHGDEMWLARIGSRITKSEYSSRAGLLQDFEQLLKNARAYNEPGHGEMADRGVLWLCESRLHGQGRCS